MDIRPRSFSALFVWALVTTGAFARAQESRWEPVSIENAEPSSRDDLYPFKIVRFANGKTLTTHHTQLEYLGSLPAKTKAPFMIFAGRTCAECDENTSIYIHSPLDGPLPFERYVYPGRLFSFETNELVEQSYLYFGSCLPNRGALAVWFQHYPSEKPPEKVFIAEVSGDSIKSGFVNPPLPKESEATSRVRQGICKAVTPRDMRSEP